MRSKIHRCLNGHSFCRYWQSPDLASCFALRCDGFGVVAQRAGEKMANTLFDWEKTAGENQFWDWKEVNFRHFAKNFWPNLKNSDLRFAYDWQFLSYEQKNAFAFRCENGDWDEMQRVFSLVLQVAAGLLNIKASEYDGVIFWQFDRSEPRFNEAQIQFLKRWQKAVFAFFRPEFVLKFHVCVRHWRDKSMEYSIVSSSIPSAHEVMEAQLKLREWARGKTPEAEVEKLLRPA